MAVRQRADTLSERDVEDMQQLIDAFLDFARGNAQMGEPEPTDPVALARSVVEDARRAGFAGPFGRGTTLGARARLLLLRRPPAVATAWGWGCLGLPGGPGGRASCLSIAY